jgi:hypothetical protein
MGRQRGMTATATGPYGVKLASYLYGRFGLVRSPATPTRRTSPHGAQALPDSLVGRHLAVGVRRFLRHARVAGHGRRMERLPGLTKGNRGYTSVIGDFENFERRDSTATSSATLPGSSRLPKPATINWQASDRFLLLGTDTDEYTIERVQVQTGTPGPPVFEIRLQSSNGSAKVKPIQADGRMLFLQRAGRKLREMGYAISSTATSRRT